MRPTDLIWVVQKAREAETSDAKTKWSKLLRLSYDPFSPDDFDIVFAACQVQPEFRNEFRFEINPVILDSTQAKQMRADWALRHPRQKKEAKPFIDPPSALQIEAKLDQCEAGNSDAWWHLNHTNWNLKLWVSYGRNRWKTPYSVYCVGRQKNPSRRDPLCETQPDQVAKLFQNGKLPNSDQSIIH